MNSIDKLTELFKEFPGIGPRQAKRFVYFLMTKNNGYSSELSKLIANIKKEVSLCTSCFRFFPIDQNQSDLCPVCSTGRDKSILLVVSRDIDFENIEKTKDYSGYYFILGGTVPILEKNPEQKIRQKELLEIVSKKISDGLKEIILALDLNPEGENTERYIKSILDKICIENNIKISILGRGLSTGTELEYSDRETLKNALDNRR
jgi:recombination protein RecR